MLFGALFSSLILLRTSAPTWPRGYDVPERPAGHDEHVRADRLVGDGRPGLGEPPARQPEARHASSSRITLLCGFGFLSSRPSSTATKFVARPLPEHATTSSRIYFTLTGLHGLHVIGGMIVFAYLLGPGAKMYAPEPRAVHQPRRGRRACTGTSSIWSGSSCSRPCISCRRVP